MDGLMSDLVSDDLYGMLGEDAVLPSKSNVHGVDRPAACKEGFDAVAGQGAFDKTVEFSKALSAITKPYLPGLTDPDHTPLKKLLFKMIIKYEIEPKFAGMDLDAMDPEKLKLLTKTGENLEKAYKVITSKEFGKIAEDFGYAYNVSEQDIEKLLNADKRSDEGLIAASKIGLNADCQLQEVLGFMSRNIPGVPEITSLYAKTPQGQKDERIREAVSEGHPESVREETEEEKTKRYEEGKKAREEAKKAEQARIAKEEKEREAKTPAGRLKSKLIACRRVIKRYTGDREKAVKENKTEEVKTIDQKLLSMKLKEAERIKEIAYQEARAKYVSSPDRQIFEYAAADIAYYKASFMLWQEIK